MDMWTSHKNVIIGSAVVAGGALVAYHLYQRQFPSKADEEYKIYTRKQLDTFHRIFQKLNKDGEGVFDQQEIRHFAKTLYVPSADQIQSRIQAFHQFKDSSISFDDIISHLQRLPSINGDENKLFIDELMMQQLKNQFDIFDSRRLGSIEYKDLVNLLRENYIPDEASTKRFVDFLKLPTDPQRPVAVLISQEEFLKRATKANGQLWL